MEADDDNGEGRRFWAEGPALSEALLRAQDELATPLPARAAKSPVFERPFAAFPHDWAAVRVVAAAALKELEYVSTAKWQRFMPGADTGAREAQVAAWRQEALALYDAAAAYPASAAVAPDRADAMWGQIEKFEPIFWPHIDSLVNEAVNLSLGLGSEAVAAIPAALIEACAWRHSLATLTIRDENMGDFKRNRELKLPWQEEDALFMQAKAAGDLKRVRDIWAPPPHRMFGPPRYVQGDVEDMVDDWLLLLELGSSEAIGLPMGDGVLQFMIRPEDLRARRFDQVIAFSTGY